MHNAIACGLTLLAASSDISIAAVNEDQEEEGVLHVSYGY